jgi:hypothetical protein
MLSIARTALRPTLARSLLATPSHASFIHTLPDLPYAYNVCPVSARLEI